MIEFIEKEVEATTNKLSMVE
jgi:hypothetical protein